MKVLDAGHKYELASLDGEHKQVLQFVKRQGDNYPGNDSAYPGTTVQENCRVLIDRLKYVQAQASQTNDYESYMEDSRCIEKLRSIIEILEHRAARKHHRRLPPIPLGTVEHIPTCEICGHIYCEKHT